MNKFLPSPPTRIKYRTCVKIASSLSSPKITGPINLPGLTRFTHSDPLRIPLISKRLTRSIHALHAILPSPPAGAPSPSPQHCRPGPDTFGHNRTHYFFPIQNPSGSIADRKPRTQSRFDSHFVPFATFCSNPVRRSGSYNKTGYLAVDPGLPPDKREFASAGRQRWVLNGTASLIEKKSGSTA
jgi:hypothetical protein